MMEKLTEQQAFLVMAKFLEAYWLRGNKQSDDIAILLSNLTLLENGTIADPAVGEDWQEAVKMVLNGRFDNKQRLS